MFPYEPAGEGTYRVHAEHPWAIPGIRVSGGAHSLIILDSFTPSRGLISQVSLLPIEDVDEAFSDH